jgi:CSLREA domain-containing protein
MNNRGMNNWSQYLSRSLAVGILTWLVLNQLLLAETITVNSTADNVQTDGQCTLREALANANNDSVGTGDCAAGSGDDVIDLRGVSGTITLTLGSRLVFYSNTNLLGPGAEILALDGNNRTQVLYVGDEVTVEIEGVTVTSGHESLGTITGGSGIFNKGTLTLINSTVSDNYAILGGGIYNKGTLTLINSTVSGNYAAELSGGGILNKGTLTLTDSIVSENSSNGDGGGIFDDNDSTLTLTSSTVSRNSTRGSGGGIFEDNSTLTLTDSIVSENSADWIGGGIYNKNNSTLTLINSTVLGNSAVNGGGISNQDILILTNSTISENSATENGGGIFNDGNLTLTNSTISENSAENGGGIFNDWRGTLIFQNALIAHSKGSDCFNDGETPTVISSLIEDGSCEATFSGDPRLEKLADNGSPTLTHALLSDSPAIDAGDANYCPEIDQRGITRPQGAGCDIGAFEFDGDLDLDQDGIVNTQDNCPLSSNPQQIDTDSDGVGDVCDNCSAMANPDQIDTDSDGIGNVCDNCLEIANPDQIDTDADGSGDSCDFNDSNHTDPEPIDTNIPNPEPVPSPTPSQGLQPLPPTMKFSITFSGEGQGRVKTEPVGIDCDSRDVVCEQVYETATWVTFTPIAAPGSQFRSWGGHSDCNDGEVFMNGFRQCIAYFDLISSRLTVTPVVGGIITSDPAGINCGFQSGPCSYRFHANTAVTLIVTPENGWQLSSWQGDCDDNGQVNLTTDQQCQPLLTPITLPITIQDPGESQITQSPTGTDCDNCQAYFELLPPPEADLPPAAPVSPSNPEIIVEESVPAEEMVSLDLVPELSSTTVISTNEPLCPTAGWLDWVCNAQKNIITELEIDPHGNLSNGILVGTIHSQGWTSNLSIQPQAVLAGGIVTGYIDNQGTMLDFEFRGAQIQGGTLAGIVINNSPIDGRITDVKLAANTYLSGGRLGGSIIGEAHAPAYLEYLTVEAGSYLNQVIIGDGVELTEGITWGKNVYFMTH